MRMPLLALALGLVTAALPARAVGNLADVTVLDRTTGRTLPVHEAGGRWYVAGQPGSRYEIRIRNATGERLLAVTSVDGVNVVTGETASPAQSGYVLDPGAHVPIRGWRKDMTRVAAFTFTALEASYAARTGRPDHVGVIGVALFREKVPVPLAEAPRDAARESRAPAPAASAGADGARRRLEANESAAVERSLGTGHGRIEHSAVRHTTFERASASPDEVIAIRYDSLENLVARGIVPRPPVEDRDPQPFPARFVPDPPSRW